MSSSKARVDADVVASTLRMLGVAVFAGIGVVVGLVLKWLMVRDGSFRETNLEVASFLVAISGAVGLGALIMVATYLVTWPDREA